MLAVIASEVNLQFNKVELERSFVQGYLRDSKVYEQGTYNGRQLKILGFTLCRHAKQSKALDSLWALINPEFKEKISKETIKVFYEEMLYFAIDLPLKMERINDQPNEEVLNYLI